jgi:Putative restriction endonuclease
MEAGAVKGICIGNGVLIESPSPWEELKMIAIKKASPKPEEPLPPLENGDHLDQKTFHERYEAMPPNVRAELIGGIVYMSSPLKRKHGRSGARLIHWLMSYEDATPGTEVVENATNILGPTSEPQPDGCLFILPECGGQVWEDDRGYINGAPEFVGEISDSTESIDLNQKKRDFEEAGVREYFVAAMRTKQIHWFIRRRGKFKELAPGSDGIFRSEVFPGLWLDPVAFLKRDGNRLLAVLRDGLASPEHAAFVGKLAAKKA